MILPVKANVFIYHIKYVLYKLQYVGKSETSFDLHLNNHRSDVFDRSSNPVCRHFWQEKVSFNNHANLYWLKVLKYRKF